MPISEATESRSSFATERRDPRVAADSGRAFLTAPIEDPAAWRGDRMAERPDWILTLDDAMTAELESAVAAVEARGIDLFDITREDFPLPGDVRSLPGHPARPGGGPGFHPAAGTSRRAVDRDREPHRDLGSRHPPRVARGPGPRRQPAARRARHGSQVRLGRLHQVLPDEPRDPAAHRRRRRLRARMRAARGRAEAGAWW